MQSFSERLEDVRRAWPTESTKWVHMASERLKWEAWGLHGSSPGSLHMLRSFVGLLTLSVYLCLLLGLFSFTGLPCLASIWGLSPCLIVPCFVMFGWCALEAYSLLQGTKGRRDLVERTCGKREVREQGAVERGETVTGCIVWEKNISSFKNGQESSLN